MNWKTSYIFIAFVAISQFSFAQICGTFVSGNQKVMEDTITVAQANPLQGLPQVNRDLSLAFYIVKDTLGNPGITTADIDAAVSRLNGYFSPVAIKFHVCKITYIDNYQFDILYSNKNEKDLTNSYFLANVISVYVVGSLTDFYNNKVSGYTYMPADKKDFVFITKQSFSGSEIGHQIGHVFNLYHTHETIFNYEYVDGSNCTKAGDKCCDTEADPNLTGKVYNCNYTGKSKDSNPSNSQLYKPSTKNLMALGKDECRCYLSPSQYLRVAYAIQKLKSNLK